MPYQKRRSSNSSSVSGSARRSPYTLRMRGKTNNIFLSAAVASEDSIFSKKPENGIVESVEEGEPSVPPTQNGIVDNSSTEGQIQSKVLETTPMPPQPTSVKPEPANLALPQPAPAFQYATGSPMPFQILKQSPFPNFTGGGVANSAGENKADPPKEKVPATPYVSPLSPEAQAALDRWTTSFLREGAAVAPSSTQGRLPPPKAHISRPSSSTYSLGYSTGSGTPAYDKPRCSYSRSSSVLSIATSDDFDAREAPQTPLDLRSPPPPESPRFFASVNPTPPPYQPATPKQQIPGTFPAVNNVGGNFRFMGARSSFAPPPRPSAFQSTISGGYRPMMTNSLGPVTGPAPRPATPTTEMLFEATNKLNAINFQTLHKPSAIPASSFGKPQHLQVIKIKSEDAMEVEPERPGPSVPQITLHYPAAAPPQISLPPPPPPPPTAFRGLSTRVIEDSFSVMLTNKLEDNYTKSRSFVMTKEGHLMTPLKYLALLCDRMEVSIHSESFRFYTAKNEVQCRTETYVGGFCGVGHALSLGFSRQLAAAHVLERMRIHFRGLKQTNYALFPGSRYTKIAPKLEELCKQFDLGEVRMVYKDRYQVPGKFSGRRGGTGGGGGGNNWNKKDLEVRWECACFVKQLQATAMSDHMLYGGFVAMKDMYLNFVKPTGAPVVQIKDYFAIGADCPMLKDIHCSLLLNRPAIDKVQWMKEFDVPASQIDAVLHDPMNNSKYLMGSQLQHFNRRGRTGPKKKNAAVDLEGDKLEQFRVKLDEALEWIQATFRRINLQGRRLRQSDRNKEEAPATDTEGDGTDAMEGNGGGSDKDTWDAEDQEIEDIFHDAVMEVELTV